MIITLQIHSLVASLGSPQQSHGIVASVFTDLAVLLHLQLECVMSAFLSDKGVSTIS